MAPLDEVGSPLPNASGNRRVNADQRGGSRNGNRPNTRRRWLAGAGVAIENWFLPEKHRPPAQPCRREGGRSCPDGLIAPAATSTATAPGESTPAAATVLSGPGFVDGERF